MSTFKGHVKEFPHLAIDYFRARGPLEPGVHAYLLSHIHTDHLRGLEVKDFGGAFIYCSQVTKTLLLKLQDPDGTMGKTYKYAHLCRNKGRTQDLLRVLPMNCPTEIRLASELVMITLLDANHCPGAVMFLVESATRSILYTGDMRAEPSFLQALQSNPIMLPYLSGVKVLDCIYLDTSARPDGPPYVSKQAGCQNLIRAIAQYPDTTSFHFDAWCLGYEDVWLSIARCFNTVVHVDHDQYTLFASIKDMPSCPSKTLATFQILTTDPQITRFHSCKGDSPKAHVRIRSVSLKRPSQAARDDLLLLEFARHSSWPELLTFVETWTPRNVVSCTGNVGSFFTHLFRSSRDHPGREEYMIGVYEDIVKQGDWVNSPLCKRLRMTQDIFL